MNKSACERIDPEQDIVSYDKFLHLYRYEIGKTCAGRFPKGIPFLDCASGNGYGAKLLSGYVNYTGVDNSAEAVDYARANYGKHGSFYLYDGSKLPFSESGFGIVCSFETIEHLSKEEHHNFINELLRVLRPGGVIIITTPNRNYLYKKYMVRKGWRNPYHKYEYDFDEFLSFMRSFSCVSIKNAYVVGFPIPLPVRRLKFTSLPYHLARYIAYKWISLGRYFPRFSNSIVVISEKV